MKNPVIRLLILLILMITASCNVSAHRQNIKCGAERTGEYFPLLRNKRVGIVANQTSMIGNVHLVDSLVKEGINVIKIFAPEHGFRGNTEDGGIIVDGRDPLSGLPVISLYGNSKELPVDQLSDIDLVIFDMQDAGVRFYTFISTMHYVMQSCARSGKQLIVLDRPNPNGNYIDGPVLEPAFRSFVGLHPIPVVHGCTIGELAAMINGEGWLDGGIKCELKIIPCSGYSHDQPYVPPVPPSPNLPNYQAIKLYPSLALFEGTIISVGRGTDFPFQVFGHPSLESGNFTFTPESRPGFSNHPPLEGKLCRGSDLRNYKPAGGWTKIHLDWLIDTYHSPGMKEKFFTSYFDKLAGTDKLRKDIEMGLTAEEIRKKWKVDLERYKKIRGRYLLY